MIQLILGLLIFFSAHAFTMLRGPRAAVADLVGPVAYKVVYSLISLAGVALIAFGYGAYRAAERLPVWDPPHFLRHLTFLLMLIAMILLVAQRPSHIKQAVKHPMIAAITIWALAHLLVRGDAGSMLLFGSFLVWGIVARVSMKQRNAEAGRPSPPLVGWSQDIVIVIVGLAVYLAFVFGLHARLIGIPLINF
jgi:uncharacterized membrane protein